MQINNVETSYTLSRACTDILAQDSPKTLSDALKERGIAEQPVKLDISKEGWAAYKQMCQPKNEDQNYKSLHIRLMPDGMAFGNEDWPDIDNFLNLNYQMLMRGKLPQAYHDPYVSIKDKASMLLNVYAQTYDEIVKGYQNGTREMYVIDMEAEDLYRKVTMEEDLEYLREEFESRASSLEKYTHEYDCKVRRDTARTSMDGVLSGGLRAALKANMSYENLKDEEKIVNIKQSLLDAASVFVSQYQKFGLSNLNIQFF